MIPNIPGGFELVIIVVVILLLFGGKKIPELARGLGKGIREFKDGLKQSDDESNKEIDDKDSKKSWSIICVVIDPVPVIFKNERFVSFDW